MSPLSVILSAAKAARVPSRRRHQAALAGILLPLTLAAAAQTASVPAGADAPLPAPASVQTTHADISPKQRREAEDAYVRGARALDHKDLHAAEQEFQRATTLNPLNRDYALALAVTREHRLTDLVQRAAAARERGHAAEADQLLQQARELDPRNAIVLQHFAPDGSLAAAPILANLPDDPTRAARAADANTLAGPVQLTPAPGVRSIHTRGSVPDLLNAVCAAYDIKATLPTPIPAGAPFRFDLEDADFNTALRVLQSVTHTFAVPMQPKELLFAPDTAENRAQYEPLIEETLFIPGATTESLTEYANLARNVFNLKVVNALASSGSLVLRGDQDTLTRLNAIYADLIDGGAEVLLDLTLYEVDKSRVSNLGTSLPSSVGVFPVAATAENLINANQSLIQEAVANNLITLTGNAYTDALTELGFLLASGTISSTEFTNLLGTFGHYAGLPLAGVFLGSGATVNALLSSSDVRILDTVQLRVAEHHDGSFRAGTRYPIETGIYSSNIGSAASSAVAGLSINGTSVSSLLSQYLGSSSAAVPQIQYEDLGLTLKATPDVLRSRDVALKLDFKLEALGSGSLNGLPVLNNRQLTSTVTVPIGQTALLASEVTRTELRSIDGLPFLSELPGFQGTEKTKEVDTTELMITLTPHVVRNKNMHITSQRLLLASGDKAQP